MTHKLKTTGWILFLLGLLGVFLPHILFLMGAFPDLLSTLDDPSHSIFEIISGVMIFFGMILIVMGITRK